MRADDEEELPLHRAPQQTVRPAAPIGVAAGLGDAGEDILLSLHVMAEVFRAVEENQFADNQKDQIISS